MDFIDAIKAYQTEGNRYIIDKILEYVEIDFLKNDTRRYRSRNASIVDIELLVPEMYVAYRIKALRERAVKGTYDPYDSAMIAAFHRFLSIIYIDLRIDFGGTIKKRYDFVYHFEITPDLIARLRSMQTRIRRKFYVEGFRDQYAGYERILGIMVEQTERANREREAVRSDVMSCVVESLEHALKYVSADRSEKEIVSYVNEAFMSKYYDLQMQKKGLRRVRIGGMRYIVEPHFGSPIKTIIGVDMSLEGVERRLTRQQFEFVREILAIVEQDIADDNTAPYRYTTFGECRISAPYVAEKRGLPYETVKRRLSRIKNIFK